MKKNLLTKLIYIILGAVSFLYLLNFSLGFTEILPDVLPIVGHIDEAVALYVLGVSLSYFGVQLPLLKK